MDVKSVDVLGVNNKVEAMVHKGYFTNLNAISSPTAWGVYFAGSGNIEGQPFAWGAYVCLGLAQIAFTANDGYKAAFRYFNDPGWDNWMIVTSA